jgi:hypothetical protein
VQTPRYLPLPQPSSNHAAWVGCYEVHRSYLSPLSGYITICADNVNFFGMKTRIYVYFDPFCGFGSATTLQKYHVVA